MKKKPANLIENNKTRADAIMRTPRQAPGSSGHFLSKNSGFEGPKFDLSLSQNSGFEAIWRAGLSTDSGFEGATERKFFEVPFIVTEGEDLLNYW